MSLFEVWQTLKEEEHFHLRKQTNPVFLCTPYFKKTYQIMYSTAGNTFRCMYCFMVKGNFKTQPQVDRLLSNSGWLSLFRTEIGGQPAVGFLMSSLNYLYLHRLEQKELKKKKRKKLNKLHFNKLKCPNTKVLT